MTAPRYIRARRRADALVFAALAVCTLAVAAFAAWTIWEVMP